MQKEELCNTHHVPREFWVTFRVQMLNQISTCHIIAQSRSSLSRGTSSIKGRIRGIWPKPSIATVKRCWILLPNRGKVVVAPCDQPAVSLSMYSPQEHAQTLVYNICITWCIYIWAATQISTNLAFTSMTSTDGLILLPLLADQDKGLLVGNTYIQTYTYIQCGSLQ